MTGFEPALQALWGLAGATPVHSAINKKDRFGNASLAALVTQSDYSANIISEFYP